MLQLWWSTLPNDQYYCKGTGWYHYPKGGVNSLKTVLLVKRPPPSQPITAAPTTVRPSTGIPTIPSRPQTPPHLSTTAPTLTTRASTLSNLDRLCDGQPDGFQSYKGKCNGFLLCLKGTPYAMNCPPGLHFSSRRGYCTQPEVSGCVLSTPAPVVATTRKAPGDSKHRSFYSTLQLQNTTV